MGSSRAFFREAHREAIRCTDDPDKLWPVKDRLDAIGLSWVVKQEHAVVGATPYSSSAPSA